VLERGDVADQKYRNCRSIHLLKGEIPGHNRQPSPFEKCPMGVLGGGGYLVGGEDLILGDDSFDGGIDGVIFHDKSFISIGLRY